MKRFFAVLWVCSGLYACKPGIPKELIQPDKMEKVLFDIHVVDGYISTMSPGADSTKKIASAFYKGIYKKFQIDSALYNQSMNYYYQHPDILKKIYDNVTTQLNKTKEKQLKTLQKATDTVKPAKAGAKPAKDSIGQAQEMQPVKLPVEVPKSASTPQK
ncbi:DUF4296 domain-containing protein [Pedobacter sp. ASV12]|uniref:DUF4296 domain-containing protein n=1 Tax=Pedobacter sp. ASV12 TaxID=2795120 RepID=UPI0018EE426D|nr:DUF4296 domain-containing protein [Pedobacter sp. ASV12]